ncbi:DNA-3-methyladenine glycosylase I [Luteibacter flocculans]|uniref:DNA-3-methyladenine glycosylase I n=1 Tax=Luteibacter flocculans TaxID=2780091 RepID=A0ABY4T1C4_9GAMM|nr:DNA-3-methyladenine glycosylase I [Luteibacter flocculans]URL58751.1 DNA-3-methyladenine glycosylase I [Luteibacter flocculans]
MRCAWAEHSDIERVYHDTEWGVPVYEDHLIFERFSLRAVQAGLAWRTVLVKRESFARAFHGFDIARVAAMGDDELAAVLADRGVIRNRLKINAIRNNARAALRVIDERGSLSAYLWAFVGGTPQVNARRGDEPLPMRSDLSDQLSEALQQRGFRFAGTAICQSLLQSAGLVNDHAVDCFRYR